VRIIETTFDRRVRAIRDKVFIQEQRVPLEEEFDEFDNAARHWLALVDGNPVGTVRLAAQSGVVESWRLLDRESGVETGNAGNVNAGENADEDASDVNTDEDAVAGEDVNACENADPPVTTPVTTSAKPLTTSPVTTSSITTTVTTSNSMPAGNGSADRSCSNIRDSSWSPGNEGYQSKRLGRLAVLREFRRRGIGKALVDRVIEAARREGLENLEAWVQTRAAPWYEQQGFTVFGPEFDDAGILHRRARLRL